MVHSDVLPAVARLAERREVHRLTAPALVHHRPLGKVRARPRHCRSSASPGPPLPCCRSAGPPGRARMPAGWVGRQGVPGLGRTDRCTCGGTSLRSAVVPGQAQEGVPRAEAADLRSRRTAPAGTADERIFGVIRVIIANFEAICGDDHPCITRSDPGGRTLLITPRNQSSSGATREYPPFGVRVRLGEGGGWALAPSACALGTGSAEVMDLLQAVDRGRDADLTGLELQPEEERVVPGLVQVAAREP